MKGLRIYVSDNVVKLSARFFHFAPVRRTVRIIAMGESGKDNNGGNILMTHHGTEARSAGLFCPEQAFCAVNRFGGVIIMAVDTAERCIGGADAGGQKGHVLFFMTFV